MLGRITVFDIVLVPVILTVVVFVHGLGHYLTARATGVRVAVFSIGFGPAIIGWTDRSGARWKVSLVPVGGYVALVRDPVASRWRRLLAAIIALGGPTASFLFAVAVIAGLLMTVGKPLAAPAKIGAVVEDSPAAQAGLQPGDEILDIDGKAVDSFAELARRISGSSGAPLRVTVRRGDQPLILTVTPRIVEEIDSLGLRRVARIGIRGSSPSYARLDPLTALAHAADQTWALAVELSRSSISAVGGERRAEGLRAPVFRLSVAAIALAAIYFMAMLSVCLGLINLLPLPFLDGGHLLLRILQAITGLGSLRPQNDQGR